MGRIIFHNGTLMKVTNTCSFDDILYVMYVTFRTEPSINMYITNLRVTGDQIAGLLVKFFGKLDSRNFVKAKTYLTTYPGE